MKYEPLIVCCLFNQSTGEEFFTSHKTCFRFGQISASNYVATAFVAPEVHIQL